MPNTAISVQGQTGAVCSQSGPYKSSGTVPVVVFIKQGDAFPPGPDGAPTTWVLMSG
ncbi:MAG TPA: hypothetical protein VIL32_12645 [Steroidobacteraceae bacterium]